MKSGVGRPIRGDHVFGPEMLEDPYPVYRDLRENKPIFRDESLDAWVVMRYDDVALVLNDSRFSSQRLGAAAAQLKAERYRPMLEVMGHKMSEKDEPDHTRLRSLVNRAFARVVAEEWTPRIQARVDQLLDGMLHAGRCEFIADFAVPLPLMTIMQLVGIPLEDRERVKRWCDDFAFVALNFYTEMSEEQVERGRTSISEFRDYLKDQIELREVSPDDNLLSAMMRAEHEGDRLSMDELLANAFLLLSAGNETTTCLLGNGLAALLRYPEQMQKLRDDPSLIPNAVEEFLRFDSPVQYLGRVAAEDVEFDSATIRRGELVLAVLGSANRDPAHFEQPDQLDVSRQENRHVAFGHGRHFCVGAQFARLEAQLAFRSLLERTTDVALDSMDVRALTHHKNFNIRCLNEIPLQFRQ